LVENYGCKDKVKKIISRMFFDQWSIKSAQM
jgi:hypothetical protein